jgi:hypothetical protein
VTRLEREDTIRVIGLREYAFERDENDVTIDWLAGEVPEPTCISSFQALVAT